MSQSLHDIPTPHFGSHFDGHMKASPFDQQQENGGINLNREKSVAHVAEYDQKEDVIDSGNQHQLQEKGQGFETKKSLAPEADVEHVKDLKGNNTHAASDDDIKPLDTRPLQDVINERRISQGKRPVDLFSDDLNHGPENCAACRHAVAPQRTVVDRGIRHLLLAKQERDRANSIPLNRRLPERPKRLPPVDPQKARENFYKNAPYMMG